MHFESLRSYLLSCQADSVVQTTLHSHFFFKIAWLSLCQSVPAPIPPFSTGNSNQVSGPNGPCPPGFERVNGSCVGKARQGAGNRGLVFQGWAARGLVVPDSPKTSSTLADVDECATGGRCQHGECANTLGGYTCVCPDGFLLDSSRSSCICEPPGKGAGL